MFSTSTRSIRRPVFKLNLSYLTCKSGTNAQRYVRNLFGIHDNLQLLSRSFSSIMCDANLEGENVIQVSKSKQNLSHDKQSRCYHRSNTSKTITSKKRRHEQGNDEKDPLLSPKHSPIKSALSERTAPSTHMTETSTGLNNAPCFVRTGISVSQLFSSISDYQYDHSTNRNVLSKPSLQEAGTDLPQIPRAPTCESLETDVPATSAEDEITNQLQQWRHWEYTDLGSDHARRRQRGMEFSVMSYNVLSQKLLEDHGYLYSGTQNEALCWEYRSKLLLEEMANHAADVMCLQEVQEDHFSEFFKPELKTLGYEGVYQKRTGDKWDGCATFYKQDRFSVGRTVPVEYCRGGLLDRDNIALILELIPKPDHYMGSVAKLCVANTHLLFNPRRGDVKLGQLVVLMAELDKVAELSPPSKSPRNVTSALNYCPVILCGDFNSEPHSDLYKFVARGYLRYHGLLSRLLSGQKEGTYGRDAFLQSDFFSKGFGITDQCQYGHVLLDRLTSSRVHNSRDYSPSNENQRPAVGDSTSSSGQERGMNMESSAMLHGHVNPKLSPMGVSQGQGSRPADFFTMGSGQLWHRLNFVSSYRHTISRLNHQFQEVTTQHNRGACNVDFIFYNVCHKEVKTRKNKIQTRNVREGKLRLLKRYGLMSEREISKLGGLPNPLCPSDHLPLISSFLLQP